MTNEPFQPVRLESTTAAATTGPASGPRPASSTPTTVAASPAMRASARARRRQASTAYSLAAGSEATVFLSVRRAALPVLRRR